MNSEHSHELRDTTLEQLAVRYESLVRDMGTLRELEELRPDALPPEEICARLAGAIARDGGAEHCSVMRFDDKSGRLHLCAVGTRYADRGFSVPQDGWQGKAFALGEGIAGHVAASRMQLRVSDTEQEPRFLPLPESQITVRSLMCFPLFAGGTLVGVLNLSHSEPGYFSPDREHGTWLVARRAGTLILEARTHQDRKTAGASAPEVSPAAKPDFSDLLHADHFHTIGQIAGKVARDLNHRIDNLADAVDLALAMDSAAERQSAIDWAQEQAHQATGRLLEFSQIMTTPRASGPVEIPGVFREVKGLLTAQSDGFELLTIDVPDECPVITGDRSRLVQTFVALGTNALKAISVKKSRSETNDRWIHLGAEIVRRTHTVPGPWGDQVDGTFIRAFVADNGMGMEPQIARDACKPFFSTHPDGTGLGLSIAFQVAREHDGWLALQSTPGYGSTVSLYLPVAEAKTRAGQPDDRGMSSGLAVVLLVDDEPLVRSVGAAILKRLGYYVLTAESGENAITVLEQYAGPIDLAIVDINMPGMNGHDMLAHLRGVNPALPVILSSGDAPPDSLDAPAHLQPTNYLEKPYLIATMAEVIREALAGNK